ERKVVLLATMGWTLYEPDASLTERGAASLPPLAPIDRITGGRGRTGTAQVADSARVRCEADRLALAALDHRNRLREIIGVANRGNVSFYPITPLRNEAFSGPAASFERLGELRGL